MNHDDAIGVQATERYLLDELPDQERDAFEEHYFGCAACADDVRNGSAFVGALKSGGRREKESPFLSRQRARARRNLMVPLAAAASVAVALLGWMQVGVVAPLRSELAEARQPSVPAEYPLRAVRGAGPQIENARFPFELKVEIPPGSVAPTGSYTCTILDARGKAHGSPVTVPAEQVSDGMLTIVVPGGALPPGDYTLRVDGINPPVAPYPFAVRPAAEKVR